MKEKKKLCDYVDLRSCAATFWERVNTADSSGKARDVAALVAKVKRDRWPFVGVRCLNVALADGSGYVPSVVTADENVIVCWESVRGGMAAADRSSLGKVAHLLPRHGGTQPATLFCIAHRFRDRWVEEDVVPTGREAAR